MKRCEYAILNSVYSFAEKRFLWRDSGDIDQPEVEKLNQFGQQGWQLVAVVPVEQTEPELTGQDSRIVTEIKYYLRRDVV